MLRFCQPVPRVGEENWTVLQLRNKLEKTCKEVMRNPASKKRHAPTSELGLNDGLNKSRKPM